MRGIILVACIFLLIMYRYSEPFRNMSGKSEHRKSEANGTRGSGARARARANNSWGPFRTWYPFMWWFGDEDDCVLEPCHDIRWY